VSLTQYFLFEGWQSLIDFMLYGSPPPQIANSSYSLPSVELDKLVGSNS
jgi:hypothetical protein